MSAVGLAARAAVVSALGFTLVPVLGADPAMACSCIQSTEQESLERADVVFKGTNDDVEATNDQFGDRVFVFTPSTTYKGTTAKPQKVFTADNSAACGVDLNGVGPFLVFAPESDGGKAGLSTSLCSGTREIGANSRPDFAPNPAVILTGGPSDPTPGSTGGGEDPMTPPCCKPLVGEPGAEPAPDAVPDNEAGGPVVAPIGAEAPLVQTTGMAVDSAAVESATLLGDEQGSTNYLPFAGAVAALGAAAFFGFGWARRRRS